MKPFKPPAVARVTKAIVVATIAAQVVLTLLGPSFESLAAVKAGLIPARLTGAVDGLPGSVPAFLTPLTSLFIHGGWLHLALNLLFLGGVGRFVEWVTGPQKFLLLYVIGALAGGVVHTIVDPRSVLPVIGASGAVSAVFGAYAILFARRRATGRRLLGQELSSELLTALWFAAVWIGLQLLTGLVMNSAGGGIAIWSHIGGFVAGLLFAQPYVRGRVPK